MQSGKRSGRPAERGEAKRSAIAIRTTPSTKARLQSAADAEGRSLTQEIEQRLERSLAAEAELGGLVSAAFLRNVASDIRCVEQATGKSWRDDFGTWAGVKAIVLDQLNRTMPALPNGTHLAAARARVEAAEEDLAAATAAIEALGFDDDTDTINYLASNAPPPSPEHAAAIMRMINANRAVGHAKTALEKAWKVADEIEDEAARNALQTIALARLKATRGAS